MVIKKITELMEKRRQRKAEDIMEEQKLESYKENEDMLKAEQVKKEADRLAHLKQYKTAIEEYNKALEIYAYNEKELMYKKSAEFFFKVFFNIAASYSNTKELIKAIDYFDKALKIENIDVEDQVKAYLSKGSTYYLANKLIKEEETASKIIIESEVKEKVLETLKKLDEKENLMQLACNCFTKATELDRNNAEAWYNKGHMEFLMNMVKESMLSFDNVLMIEKEFENKEEISLFEDIRLEKGIQSKKSNSTKEEKKFKTKTGHFVNNKAEKMIANFLFDNNLIFQYNMVVSWSDEDDFKSAFYIPKLKLHLEHFKHDYIKENKELMEWKINQYDKNKKKLVYTISKDEENIEEALKIKIKPYIAL